MPIPETQLDTWSKQGSKTQSQTTYATIKAALEDSNASYNDKFYACFYKGPTETTRISMQTAMLTL